MADQVAEILSVIMSQGAVIVVIAILILIILSIVSAVIIYFVIRRIMYNQTVILFQKINGRFEPVGNYKARFIAVGKGGDTALHVLKVKKYLPAPTIQTGRNKYWFFQREDGEWINFGTGDFDMDSREVGAKFLDTEMRYARTQLQDKIIARYSKQNWLKENWPMIVAIIVIFILLLFMYLIVAKLVEAMAMYTSSAQVWKEIADSLKQTLGTLDSLKSGGSGISPAS